MYPSISSIHRLKPLIWVSKRLTRMLASKIPRDGRRTRHAIFCYQINFVYAFLTSDRFHPGATQNFFLHHSKTKLEKENEKRLSLHLFVQGSSSRIWRYSVVPASKLSSIQQSAWLCRSKIYVCKLLESQDQKIRTRSLDGEQNSSFTTERMEKSESLPPKK